MTTDPMTTTTIATAHGEVPLTLEQYGQGRPFLFLHGGAGPVSVTGFARTFAAEREARVLVPTHPGFNGTTRPGWLQSPRELAELYLALLDQLDLREVTVLGSSIGGWIAAELALLASPRVSAVILVNAVGIEVHEHPVADIFALSMDELADLSYHDPSSFRLDLSALSDAQRAVMAGNRQAIALYGGSMVDPSLRSRLADVTVPALVLWGESDGIAVPAYGEVFARAIPGADFVLVRGAGHLPQVETPEQLVGPVWDFARAQADPPSGERIGVAMGVSQVC